MILGPDSFRPMPWANGKGTTVEMLRIDGPGGLVLRISRAAVVENGDFSIFPGIDRSLTVLSGPGFDLSGPGLHLQARPLQPVTFAGDLPLKAVSVTAQCEDFNVMWARGLPRPDVCLLRPGQAISGPALFLYALAAADVSGRALPAGSLLISRDQAVLSAGGPVIGVAVTGLVEGQMRNIG